MCNIKTTHKKNAKKRKKGVDVFNNDHTTKIYITYTNLRHQVFRPKAVY